MVLNCVKRRLISVKYKSHLSILLAVVIFLVSSVSVLLYALTTHSIKEEYLMSDDFETNTFWSSGRIASNQAFSGDYIIKGNSTSAPVYSKALTLEKGITYSFQFWYRNPIADSTDKVGVYYKSKYSSRYTAIKTVTLSQNEGWSFCSFEFSHTAYSEFYFGVTGTDVEIDSVSVSMLYKTAGNLIENGSFENGDINWKGINDDSLSFRGNAIEGMACGVISAGGGAYCDFETIPYAEYTLSFKYKGDFSGAKYALSRVRSGFDEIDLITDKYSLSVANDWQEVSFEFGSGRCSAQRFVLWASDKGELQIDSVKVTPTASKNLLKNAGFEDGSNNWSVSSGSITTSVLANSGESSLKQPDGLYKKVWQTFEAEKNTDYLLSFCYKGTSWLKWSVSDATNSDTEGYSPDTDKGAGYITGNSASPADKVNWDNVSVVFNSGEYERVAFALQTATATSDLLFDDISVTKITPISHNDGCFVTYANKTPYNDYPYITDAENNLFGDFGFETSVSSAWNTPSFINSCGEIVSDGENGAVYKFTAGDTEAINSVTMQVKPNTDYWLTLKIKTPDLSEENTAKLYYGIANVDTNEFLLGKEPDKEEYRAFNAAEQLNVVAADGDWHLVSAKFRTADETKLLFVIRGTKSVSYFDDIYFFEDVNKVGFVSEFDKISDISVTDKNPTLRNIKPDGTNLFENSEFSDGDYFWNTEGDGNVLFGKNLSVAIDKTTLMGNSLKYSNQAKFPKRIYYIKWVDVQPDTEYTFAAKCRIINWVDDKIVPAIALDDDKTVFKNAYTLQGGFFGLISGYRVSSEISENQMLPTPIIKYKFSSKNYNNSQWEEVAISFNSGERNRVGFMVFDGGGEALIDDVRLFRTQDAALKGTAAKPTSLPEIKYKSFDRIAFEKIEGMLYGKSEDNNEFFWNEDPVFTDLEPDSKYYFSVKYKETDEKYESDMADSVEVLTYKKGDVNRDGRVNVTDLVRLKKNNVNLMENDYVSDLDCNEVIGADDLVILKQILLGII